MQYQKQQTAKPYLLHLSTVLLFLRHLQKFQGEVRLGDEYRGGMLAELASDYVKRNALDAKSATFTETCASFVHTKKRIRSRRYIADIVRLPLNFPTLADRKVSSITHLDVKDALDGSTETVWNLKRREISAVLTHAKEKGWLTEHPLSGRLKEIELPPRTAIETLTAAQVRALFDAAIELDPEQIPLLAVRTFAGVRPEESLKLTWENIDLQSGYLTVPNTVAKRKRARHIQMHATLRTWLEWSGFGTGPIVQRDGLRGRINAVRERAGLDNHGQRIACGIRSLLQLWPATGVTCRGYAWIWGTRTRTCYGSITIIR